MQAPHGKFTIGPLSPVFRLLAPSIAQAGRLLRLLDPEFYPAPSELPISIYLSDEAAHAKVQGAVEDLVVRTGGWTVDADEPIIGSWFRRMRGRNRLAARTPKGRELAHVAAHAAEARLVFGQDATITATMLQNLGPVPTASSRRRKRSSGSVRS